MILYFCDSKYYHTKTFKFLMLWREIIQKMLDGLNKYRLIWKNSKLEIFIDFFDKIIIKQSENLVDYNFYF